MPFVDRIHTVIIYNQFFHSCYFVLIRLSRRSVTKTDGYIFFGLSNLGIGKENYTLLFAISPHADLSSLPSPSLPRRNAMKTGLVKHI